MTLEPPHNHRPDWNGLFSTALEQEGYFTTGQAAEAGYGPQLIHHHIQAGRFQRVARGIYRLVHYPPGDNEHLIIAWLWTGHQGVVALESALALHGLSDALPGEAHFAVPSAWSVRRLRVPRGIRLHFVDVSEADRQWYGCLPITTPQRTLRDCALEHVSPELIEQAVHQGLDRGLFRGEEISEALTYIERFDREAEDV